MNEWTHHKSSREYCSGLGRGNMNAARTIRRQDTRGMIHPRERKRIAREKEKKRERERERERERKRERVGLSLT